MKVCAVADLHGHLPDIEPCDALLVAGDITPVWNHNVDFQFAWLDNKFREWLDKVPTDNVFGVAGNHDWCFQRGFFPRDLPWKYLEDDGVEFEGKVLWGSPWQPPFFDWAFNLEETFLAAKWERIPDDVDVLILHGPPYGLGDLTLGHFGPPEHAGSNTLRYELDHRLNPELCVFGHIHSAYGEYELNDIRLANCSHVNEKYKPVNEPLYFELRGGQEG